MTVREIYETIDKAVAPFALAESWDNSGLLVGDPQARVDRALLCLDITWQTAAEAARLGAQLVISHHPVIFTPLKSVLRDSAVYALIRQNLSAICAHTNLDIAGEGVNDCLAQALALAQTEPFQAADENHSLGRIGVLPREMRPKEFAAHVRGALHIQGSVRYVDGGAPILRVAVCGGAGGSLAYLAREKGAQAIVTSEIKHNILWDCAAMGLTAVDAGHDETERVVLEPLARRLGTLCPETTFLLSAQKGPALFA